MPDLHAVTEESGGPADSGAPIYMDYQASTPIDPRVLDAMMPYLTTSYGNPGSAHIFGERTLAAVTEARAQVAAAIGASAREIVFTSGATESINLCLKGLWEAGKIRRVVTVATEHPAVLECLKYLAGKGLRVEFLGVGSDGIIALDDPLLAGLDPGTLVVVMAVNNEIGVIQPIVEVGELTKRSGALFFSDLSQAVGKIEVDVREAGIDYACVSSHKVYGPGGVGALFVSRSAARPAPLAHGGGQEGSLRSGSLNVPGIIGFAKACRLAKRLMGEERVRISGYSDMLLRLLRELGGVRLNGCAVRRVPHNLNLFFPGVSSDAIIWRLKDRVAMGRGSACKAHALEPSAVLQALGLSGEEALSSVRLSLGRFSAVEDVQLAAKWLRQEVTNLRRL